MPQPRCSPVSSSASWDAWHGTASGAMAILGGNPVPTQCPCSRPLEISKVFWFPDLQTPRSPSFYSPRSALGHLGSLPHHPHPSALDPGAEQRSSTCSECSGAKAFSTSELRWQEHRAGHTRSAQGAPPQGASMPTPGRRSPRCTAPANSLGASTAPLGNSPGDVDQKQGDPWPNVMKRAIAFSHTPSITGFPSFSTPEFFTLPGPGSSSTWQHAIATRLLQSTL